MYPFVHRFKTEDNYYVYDVHSAEIIQVDEAVFEIIESYSESEEELLINRFSDRFSIEVIQDAFSVIKQAGREHSLFSSRRPKHEIIVFDRETLTKSINSGLQVLTLGITENCNLDCCYCVYSGRYSERRVHSNRDMDFSTARKAVDYLKQHNRPEINPPGIGFYGGEPLLRFPFIKKVTEYARRIFPENMLGFTITTNGTIFTDEMLDFFEKNAFFVLVSLDGPRQYHDRSRKFKNNKGSWDCIMKNLEKIRKKYPGIFKRRLMLSTTIAPPASYKELDDFFSEFGVSQRIGLVEAASLKDCKQFKFISGQ